MNTTTSPLPHVLGIPHASLLPALDLFRFVAATAVAALVGTTLASMTAVPTPIALFVLFGLAMLAATRDVSPTASDWLQRGFAVVAFGVAAGVQALNQQFALMYLFGALAFAFACGTFHWGASRRMTRNVTVVVAGIGASIALAVVHLAFDANGLYWGVTTPLEQASAGGLIGVGAWFGQLAGARMARQNRLPAAALKDENASAEPDPIADAMASLNNTGDRVLCLLDVLESEQSSGLVLVEEVRGNVSDTLRAADRGATRWAIVDTALDTARAEALKRRIQKNAREREAASEDLVAVIDDTISRQRTALAEIEAVERRRRAFAFRIQTAEAGLDVLRVAVERAVTEGDELAPEDVDVLVASLNDARAFFMESAV